jgi:serpin B
MTYEGASGTTADEIRNVFYFPEGDEKRRSAFARVYNNLNQSASKGNYTINIANALWNEQKYPFKQSFYDTIEKYYYGKSKSVDFINNPEEQRQEINLWVEDQTNKKIVELLPKASIKDVTRMVLVNAIYFKGDWNTKFDEENTYGGLFNTSLENSEEVQMMYQKNKFNYYEDDSFQYLELPYKGNDVSMIIILPKEIVIDYKIPSASELLNMKLTMINQEVEVHLPKFKFETKYKLKNDLIEMGVKEAFTNDADFSKMDEENFVKIDEIYHQAFIEINEEGTEAAAATAVVIIEKTSMPLNTVFNANRPFTFYIQNNEANEILFLGKMIDPNK